MFEKELIQQVADALYLRQHTLAVAESVTAGLVQNAFASVENAAAFFQGGLTAYNARQKYIHLHVNLKEALSCNAVSARVAGEMAIGVRKAFSSDWGIGITGYASQMPGHQMNPLHAYYAICFKHKIAVAGMLISGIEPTFAVQLTYVNDLMHNFWVAVQQQYEMV